MRVQEIREFFMSDAFVCDVFTHSFRKRRFATRRSPYFHLIRNDPCAYCGGEGGTVDHVVPQAQGGEDRDNIVGSCQPCNNAKQDKGLLEFLLEMRV